MGIDVLNDVVVGSIVAEAESGLALDGYGVALLNWRATGDWDDSVGRKAVPSGLSEDKFLDRLICVDEREMGKEWFVAFEVGADDEALDISK